MTSTLPIPKLHREYTTWMAELKFAKEEISLFERFLTKLSANYFRAEITTQIECFQNRFILHKDVVDQLRHDLHSSENELVKLVKEFSGMGLDYIRMDNHCSIREQMCTFRQVYTELKRDFRRFEAKWY